MLSHAGHAVKRIVLPVILVLFLVPTTWAKDGHIDILMLNDTHSQLQPVSTKLHGIDMKVGGFVSVAEWVRSERDETPDALLVLTGDIAYGPMYRSFGGEPEYRALSALEPTAGTLGNHEFDYGAERLKRTIGFASFPVVVSNVEFSDPDLKKLFPETLVVENRGLRVGFFGLMTPTLPAVSSPGEGVKVDFDLAAVAARCIAELHRQGVDVVVALTHIGTTADLDLASRVAGIHAIIGGHSHTLMPVKTIVRGPNGWETIVGQAESHTHYAGRLGLTVRGGRTDAEASTWHTALIVPDPDYANDPTVVRVGETVASFAGRFDAELSKPIGAFSAPADATQKLARGGESPMGNFVADAYRWRLAADIGAVNGGNIRGDRIFPEGEVSYKTLMEVQPYGNTLTTVWLTGRQLRTLAEIGASALVEGDTYDAAVRVSTGGFLQYSGMKVELNPSAPPMKIDGEGRVLSPGSRVRSLKVERDGKWVDPEPDRLYSITTASWTAGGGDKTVVMKEAARKEPSELTDVNVLADYLAHLGGAAEPKAEGRITIVR